MKVILPDGTEIDNIDIDPRIWTKLKLFPLGSKLEKANGEKLYYCYFQRKANAVI